MRSLKRSRNDPPELYTRTGRKKIRSNNLAESPHLPLDRHLDALIESTVVNLPAQSISSTVPIRCIHKLCYSCSLSESICCACVDKRPISTSYPPNIYRRGSHGTTDVRSEWYCPGCKDNWFGRRVLKPRESLRAKGVGDLIRVTCIDQTFDLIRSEDLTWAKLQIEVSLLLGCNPRKLDFVANEMDLEMIMELGVIVPTARKTRASQIHFNYMRNSGSEDEEMEDVS